MLNRQKLIALRRLKGFEHASTFAKAVGISQKQYWDIENTPVQNITTKTLLKLTSFLGVPLDYLFDQQERLFLTNPEGNPVPVIIVPIISWNEWLHGQGESNQMQNVQNTNNAQIQNQVFLFINNNIKPEAKYLASKIKDDSMFSQNNTESFSLGDVVIFEKTNIAKAGDYVVVQINGNNEAIFRKLIAVGSDQFLIPLNPNYPKEKLDEKISILGVACQFSRDIFKG
jgi:transcriptional regulator with XRE-family HTH domain